MIAIIITEQIKNDNQLDGTNGTIGSVYTLNSYPNKWVADDLAYFGYASRTDLHAGHGWGEVVVPSLSENQILGDVYRDTVNNIFTHHVIDLTNEQMKQIALDKMSIDRSVQVQLKTEEKIIEEAQLITSDLKAHENYALYPIWDDFADQHLFPAQFKVNHWVGNELKLYKSIQPSNKAFNTKPDTYAAGWYLIEFIAGIEIWSQPIGGDGKYPYINPDTGQPYQVVHNGFIWTNLFQSGLNVWEPTVSNSTLWQKGDAI